MYVIREALPKQLHFLAYVFAGVGLIGCLPALQSNQLIQIFRDLIFTDLGFIRPGEDPFLFNLGSGFVLAAVTGAVVFGGLRRIAKVAVALVPSMTILYVGSAVVALALNLEAVPAALQLIVSDAFTGDAAAGGSLLFVILYGVRRGAYSNEAGMGTESMAHGAARTREPVREGLVAMLGPVVDTLLICTATALMILVSGVYLTDLSEGVTLTASAFSTLLGPFGTVAIFTCVICFAATTIFTYSFYGSQCASFLFGANSRPLYQVVYVSFILLASVISIDAAVNLIDGCFALMAIPTMISALWLAPRVMEAARVYFTASFGTEH
jgi:AGCS family alanine or glycine:cation symporter